MSNNNLSDVLDGLKGEAVTQSKEQLQEWIAEAKASGDDYIRSTAEQLEEWLVDVSNGPANGGVSKDEFDQWMSEQQEAAAVFVSQQALDARARAEKLTVKMLVLAAEKIVPLLLV